MTTIPPSIIGTASPILVDAYITKRALAVAAP
jgi:hypothetical protein